jgi:hypothetical protein
MSATAVAERGLVENLKGFRWLELCPPRPAQDVIRFVIYLPVIVPDEAGLISILFPTTLGISNTASDIAPAVDIPMEASARWRPKHQKH